MRELETGRLLLRKLRREDAQRIFDFWACDPEVTKYLTWQPHESVAETEQILALWLEEDSKPETCRYGIELKASGELIGMIDAVGFPGGNPVLGYCSGRPAWGHGYMTEALKAVCAALFEEGHGTLEIDAIAENIGSNRVIQKAGFRLVEQRQRPQSAVKPEIVTVNHYILERA